MCLELVCLQPAYKQKKPTTTAALTDHSAAFACEYTCNREKEELLMYNCNNIILIIIITLNAYINFNTKPTQYYLKCKYKSISHLRHCSFEIISVSPLSFQHVCQYSFWRGWDLLLSMYACVCFICIPSK